MARPVWKWTKKIARIVGGVLLILGGVFGFLPILGFWMVPLGVSLLAVDWPPARRAWRRMKVWGLRRWQRIGPKVCPFRKHEIES